MENTFVSADTVASNEGINKTQLIGKYYTKNEVPATCSHGCMVHPEELCLHNQPSILVELKLV